MIKIMINVGLNKHGWQNRIQKEFSLRISLGLRLESAPAVIRHRLRKHSVQRAARGEIGREPFFP